MNKQELIKHFEEMECVSIVQMGKKSFIDMIEQLDKPQKVTVPQFVDNYIKYTQINEWDLLEAMENIAYEDDKELRKWFVNNSENFALAWINGYEIEKEKRYLVKMKNINSEDCYLKRVANSWIISNHDEHKGLHIHTAHTRKELEEAGFGEVFNSKLFEVKEVKDES